MPVDRHGPTDRLERGIETLIGQPVELGRTDVEALAQVAIGAKGDAVAALAPATNSSYRPSSSVRVRRPGDPSWTTLAPASNSPVALVTCPKTRSSARSTTVSRTASAPARTIASAELVAVVGQRPDLVLAFLQARDLERAIGLGLGSLLGLRPRHQDGRIACRAVQPSLDLEPGDRRAVLIQHAPEDVTIVVRNPQLESLHLARRQLERRGGPQLRTPGHLHAVAIAAGGRVRRSPDRRRPPCGSALLPSSGARPQRDPDTRERLVQEAHGSR